MLPSISTRRTIDTMPDHARVWVYKSAIAFSPGQKEEILARGAAFATGWAAHGSPLDACVDVLHDHFVVVAVDEQQALASGCSIDKSVHLVQEMERDLGVVLTDRMVVIYERNGAPVTCRVQELPALAKAGEITGDTMVFDDLITTKADLEHRFRVPLRSTWMARYL